MRHHPLGNTGLQVSTLGFGAAPLGDVYGAIDEAAGIAAVHAAIDAGINYFDVAPLYGFGLAETRLGKALAGRRQQVVLATKCCRDTFDDFDFSARRVTASLEESLRRLQTDHVDVYQIHDVEFGDREQVLHEAIPAALALKQAGKVGFVGITGLPVRYLRLLLEQADVDTVLSWAHYNLLEDELDEELVPVCAARGIGLISASPLLQGLLTERPPPPWHRSPAAVLAVAPVLAARCRRAGFDLAQVAVRHAIGHPQIATTIVGMKSVAEVRANLAALDLQLPESLLRELTALAAPVQNRMWFEGRPENNIPPRHPDRHVPHAPGATHGGPSPLSVNP
jgi:L-galactose dehydrogenase